MEGEVGVWKTWELKTGVRRGDGEGRNDGER